MRLLRLKFAKPKCDLKHDNHAVEPEELDELRKNPQFPIETVCTKCDRDVRISKDYDDPKNFYWIAEL